MEVPAPANGGAAAEEAAAAAAGTKRQRRPSVRLGEIGAVVHHDSHLRRSKQGKVSPHQLQPDLFHGDPSMASGSIWLGRTSSRLCLEDRSLQMNEEAAGSRKGCGEASVGKNGSAPAGRRPVRMNWAAEAEDGMDAPDFKPNDDGAADEGYRDSDEPDESSSQMKDDSRGNDSDGREAGAAGAGAAAAASEAAEADMQLESDLGLLGNRRLRSLEDGSVRAWLNGLGLGRYVPVFQIHEVDDEVLPFLTLEDLKEMGITAVGSRRKIFFAIQKLGKSFS